MITHEVFAQIFEGEVKNIIVCLSYVEANNLTKIVYGLDAFAVDCLQYPIGIGDKYHDGRFWRVNAETNVEEVVMPNPTEKQEIEVLTTENVDLQLALVEQYEKNIDLTEEITNVQMAITELYEGKEV